MQCNAIMHTTTTSAADHNSNLLDPNRWMYLGEGNAHVVLAFSNEPVVRSDDDDSLLSSIPSPALSLSINNSKTQIVMRICKTSHGDENDRLRERHRSAFVERILKPCIGETFLNAPLRPSPLIVTTEFLLAVQTKWRDSGKVPTSRISQWQQTNLWSKMVTLYRNIRTSQQQFTIELKPKCGFLPTTPSIHPNHRSKYKKHRFGLMQGLMKGGYLKKGWQTPSDQDDFTQSKYSPLHLFSREPDRVKYSLEKLIENPQNNLRIWHNSSILLDNTTNIFSTLELSNSKSNEVPMSTKDKLVAIITEILSSREPILSSLLSLQKADIIDVDGANLIYDRLVQICGSKDEADTSLIITAPCAMSTSKDDIIPLPKPLCPALSIFLDEIFSFSVGNSLSDDQMDEAWNRCSKLISSLSRDACIWLLQGWLISLSACDASIMLSIDFFDQTTTRQEVQQTQSSNGSFLYDDKLVCYLIKLIDIDSKPTSKLRNRKLKERIFSNS